MGKKNFIIGFILLFIGFSLGIFTKANINLTFLQKNPVLPTINATPTPLTLTVKEPDNSFTTAMHISPETIIKGNLSSSSDMDFYSFGIDKLSHVRISLKDVPKDYDLYIYDGKKTIVAWSRRSGFEAGASLLTLSNPGTYYLKISPNGVIQKPIVYTLTLSIFPIN